MLKILVQLFLKINLPILKTNNNKIILSKMRNLFTTIAIFVITL